jgi:hypothetical protein
LYLKHVIQPNGQMQRAKKWTKSKKQDVQSVVYVIPEMSERWRNPRTVPRKSDFGAVEMNKRHRQALVPNRVAL